MSAVQQTTTDIAGALRVPMLQRMNGNLHTSSKNAQAPVDIIRTH
jgi:hypothetical protein